MSLIGAGWSAIGRVYGAAASIGIGVAILGTIIIGGLIVVNLILAGVGVAPLVAAVPVLAWILGAGLALIAVLLFGTLAICGVLLVADSFFNAMGVVMGGGGVPAAVGRFVVDTRTNGQRFLDGARSTFGSAVSAAGSFFRGIFGGE